MIRVLLVEDQSMVAGALAALLGLETDIEVVASCGDAESAWQRLHSDPPDILLTDIEMPGHSGLDLAARVQSERLPVRVIVLTTFARPGYLRRALDAGVRGYLLKAAPSEHLAQAIRTVRAGGKVIAPELALDAWEARDPLTERERQVLRLAGEGQTSGEIAQALHLSEGTVRNYLSEIIGKLGVGNRIEAWRLARQRGWL